MIEVNTDTMEAVEGVDERLRDQAMALMIKITLASAEIAMLWLSGKEEEAMKRVESAPDRIRPSVAAMSAGAIVLEAGALKGSKFPSRLLLRSFGLEGPPSTPPKGGGPPKGTQGDDSGV